MAKRFYKKGNMSALSKLLLGTLMSLASVLLFSVIFGAAAMLFRDVTGRIPLFALLTVIFSSFAAGVAVSRLIADGSLPLSLLIALMSALIMMLIGIIAGGGSVSVSVFLNLLIFMGVFGLSAYLFKKREGRMKKFKM